MTASLESPEETEAEGAEDEEAGSAPVSITIDGQSVALHVPRDATRPQTAAIACAIGSHLTDRQRAAAAAAAEASESADYADPWSLAGRMKSVGKRRWPDDVERGDEWRAAARSR